MISIGIGLYNSTPIVFPSWVLPSDLSASPWSRSSATASSGFSDSDGGTSASKLSDAAASAYHYAQYTLSPSYVVAGATYTFGHDLNAGTRRYAYLQIYDGVASRGCAIDLQTGTLGTPYNGATATVSSRGGGWYRLTIRVPLSASASMIVAAVCLSNINAQATYLGNGSYIYAYNPVLSRVA